MRHVQMLASVVLMGVLVIGCKKEAEKQTPTAPGTATPTAEPAKGTAEPGAKIDEAVKTTVQETGAKVDEGAKAATGAVEDAAKSATGAANDAAKSATGAADDAAKAAAAAKEQLAKESQSQLDKILQAVKDGKLTDAEKLLAALEAKVGSLPAPLPERIAAARKALDAAKLAEQGKSLLPGNAPK